MNKDMLRTKELYDLSHTAAAPLLENTQYPWEALSQLGDYIVELGKTLPAGEYEQRGEDVWIHKTAKIYPNNYIAGPCIIGPETEVRPGAFIRGKALVGAHCVVGNSTELKNVILFDNVQVPHYNYVGDSILGYKSHMGAGALTSNVKQDKTPVTVRVGEERLETGLQHGAQPRHGGGQKRPGVPPLHGAGLCARGAHSQKHRGSGPPAGQGLRPGG